MAKRITELDEQLSPPLGSTYLGVDSAANNTKRVAISDLLGDNVKLVNKMEDFPTAVSGVITLGDNTVYVIGTNLSTADRFVWGTDSVITGVAVTRAASITYTGTGALFTSLGVAVNLINLSITCSSGTLFDLDSNSLPFRILKIENLTVIDCDTVGTWDGMNLNAESFSILNMSTGLTVTGSNISFFNMEAFNWFDDNASCVAIDFSTATLDKVQLMTGGFTGSGTAISGLTASGNITAGHLAEVSGVNLDAIATPFSGIARDDFRWIFKNCAGIRDSHRIAEADLTVTETTTINTIGVYERINGTNWSDETSESFSIATSGVITYIGEQERSFMVSISSTMEKVGGGADAISLRIGVDTGSGYVTQARSTGTTQNATPTSVISQGIYTLTEGDLIAPHVANNDSTSNIDISLCNISIHETTG